LGSGYVLEGAIARGATGEVWRGRSNADGSPFAFKVLHYALGRDPEKVRRFVQESAILTGLDHPNLVKVYDLVVEGETLAIVMDLIEGRDLRGILTEHGSLLPAEACRIGAQTAAGLTAVHEAGVVHRDIKPENVLMDLRVMPPAVRLTDFGIARIAEQSGSARSTMLVGTPQYVAPEVFDGHAPTPASDLYALGIMLYEMCCGTTPFAGGSTLQVLRRHVECAPGRPPGIPDPLWELIAGLLAKNPAERPGPSARLVDHLTALGRDLIGVSAVPS
jgi:serine/threonine-protein kinase